MNATKHEVDDERRELLQRVAFAKRRAHAEMLVRQYGWTAEDAASAAKRTYSAAWLRTFSTAALRVLIAVD